MEDSAFVICTVRKATPQQMSRQQEYVQSLEDSGYRVHYPPRDTNQQQSGYDICRQNAEAISAAKEIHIFYDPDSQGGHFDMGVAFALHVMGINKPITIVQNGEVLPGKCYPRMLLEWKEIVDVA